MNGTDPSVVDSAVEAAVEVLDTMFFELPAGTPQVWEGPPPDALCALVRFAGTSEGRLAVVLEPLSVHRLAAAFLGMDEGETTEGQAADVLCELANMICGASLSRLNPDSRIVIESPKVVPVSEVSAAPWVRFPLECGSLAISLTYRGH